jgi:hypothetical protein
MGPLSAIVSHLNRFILCRYTDVNGVSGVGVVADGVVDAFGRAVLIWRSGASSVENPGAVAVYPSIEELRAIHGHHGSTDVLFVE